MDKITEAINKVAYMPAGSEREENLVELVALLDRDREDLGRKYLHALRLATSYMTENRELRAEVQRLQSEAAVRMTA